MNKNLRKIEIFVSSPGDTSAERKIITQAIEELNNLQSIKKHFHLQALTYEQETPGAVGAIPQRTIDQYMTQPKDTDIFICVFWSRMGTPFSDPDTQRSYQSGTHYEFLQAYEANQEQGRPIILLYRCMRPILPSNNLDQAMRVQKFFTDFEGPEAAFKGLYKPYTSLDEFAQVVRQDLDKVLSQMTLPDESNAIAGINTSITQGRLRDYLSLVVEQSRHVPYHLNLPISLDHVDYEKIEIRPRLIVPRTIPAQFSSINDLVSAAGKSIDRFDMDEFLNGGNRLLLMGEIGSGKTVLAKQICRTLAMNYLQSGSGRIPVYISGLEISLYLDSHAEHINSSTESPYLHYGSHVMDTSGHQDLSVKFWRDLFKNYPILLVIDGVDEIAIRWRVYLIDALSQLQRRYPDTQTVVTLRPSAFSGDMFGGDYQCSCLLPLDDTQQQELIEKLKCVSTDSALLLNSSQFSLIDYRGMRRLQTPLYLTAISLMDSHVPPNAQLVQTLILERILKLILNDWDAAKFRHARIRVGFLGGATNDSAGPTDIELLEFIAWNNYVQELETLDLDVLVEWFVTLDGKLNRHQAKQMVTNRVTGLYESSDLLAYSQDKVRFKESIDELYFAGSRYARSIKTWRELLSFLPDIQKHRKLFSILYDLIVLKDLKDHRISHDFLVFMLDYVDKLPDLQSRAEFILYLSECFLKTADSMLELRERMVHGILILIEDKAQVVILTTRIQLGRALGLIGDSRIGTNMVLIPKGEFFMGYDMFPEDRPAQRVIVDDFYIDKYPVTNAQFLSFIQGNGYSNQEYWTEEGWKWVQATKRQHPKYWNDMRFNLPNYPVVGVTWYEAAAYAKWAGKRLPTEKEWEKASRGSERNPQTKRLIGPSWAWGNEFRSDYLNCAEGQNQVNGTTPIGIYPAGISPYGIYDMCGNVSEWTADWYQPYESNTYVDSHFGEKYRVRRGGGWGADQDFVRCTCRIGSLPIVDFAVVGFRCCVTMRP